MLHAATHTEPAPSSVCSIHVRGPGVTPTVSPLSAYLKAGDGVLDLGANVGEYALAFAERVGPSGFVLAVEPDPHTAQFCQAVTNAYPHVHVLPAAVSRFGGVVKLHCDAENTRRHSLYRANLTNDSDRVRVVASLTLDDLVDAVPKLRAIKMDVQGAELDAILGGWQTLYYRRDLVWYVEIWQQGLVQAGGSASALANTFSKDGWHPEGTTWPAVVARAVERPEAVQNVLLRYRHAAA